MFIKLLNMKSEIIIEKRLIKGKEIECYVPKINGINILESNSFILKESIVNDKEKFDNIKIAEFFLQDKIKEINIFLEKIINL